MAAAAARVQAAQAVVADRHDREAVRTRAAARPAAEAPQSPEEEGRPKAAARQSLAGHPEAAAHQGSYSAVAGGGPGLFGPGGWRRVCYCR